MADEPKDEQQQHDGEGEKKGGLMALLTKTPVIVALTMIIQGGVIGGIWFFSGGPADATADVHLEGAEDAPVEYDDHGNPLPPKADVGSDVLIDIAELRAHNTRSGRHYLFDVTFYAVVHAEHAEDVKAKIETYGPLIQDRGRTIIGGIDPEKLSGKEPGLETLRRKMLHELEAIVGEDAVKEVVVPRCVPFRIDY